MADGLVGDDFARNIYIIDRHTHEIYFFQQVIK